MPRLRENSSVATVHGRWGEDFACEVLRAKGYEIFERNSTPCVRDRRLEIDIVAYERSTDTLVFVEVKQHKEHSPFGSRLRSIDKRKLRNMKTVCNAWCRVNKWRTGFRFDVIEIYGTPEAGLPQYDHVENVRCFKGNNEFVDWRK